MSLAQDLVSLSLSLDVTALPAATRTAVLRNTLQIFGAAKLGLQNPFAGNGVAALATYERGSDATVVGHGVRSASASTAAFANTLAAHADFREDTHSESSSHPGVVVMPVAFAVAELLGGTVPADKVVQAIVAGHEVIGRLGPAGVREIIARGFRTPSVYPVFGGAVAAGILLGLSDKEMVHALALASQGASGINHPFIAGTDEWYLAPALAARHAVTSALLAKSGLTGSAQALEGAEGVFSAFGGVTAPQVDLTPVAQRGYEIEHARLKPVLTCAWNQSLVHQLSLLAPDVAEVARVEVRMSAVAGEYPGVANESHVGSRSAALLSAPFAAALQLVRGSLDHAGYERLDDPALVAAAAKVRVSVDRDLVGYATAVDVHCADGRVLHSEDDNEQPRFSATTPERVVEILRRHYDSSGRSGEEVDRLVEGVTAFVDGGRTAPLADFLGTH